MEILHCEGDESLEEVVQRSRGCSIPGSVKGQVGCGPEQTDLVCGILAHGEELALDDF